MPPILLERESRHHVVSDVRHFSGSPQHPQLPDENALPDN